MFPVSYALRAQETGNTKNQWFWAHSSNTLSSQRCPPPDWTIVVRAGFWLWNRELCGSTGCLCFAQVHEESLNCCAEGATLRRRVWWEYCIFQFCECAFLMFPVSCALRAQETGNTQNQWFWTHSSNTPSSQSCPAQLNDRRSGGLLAL